jgi:hypothetical protein
VIDQGMGEPEGRGIILEDLPTGSIVYVGRGSFRMEAISVADDLARGVVQPVASVATAPYHDGPRPSGESSGVEALDRAPSSASWRAPDLRPLFGSQVDVPLLSAPTGALPEREGIVLLSRAAIAAMGALIFACGLLAGAAAWHRPRTSVALTPVAPPPVALPPEPQPATPSTPAAPEPRLVAPPTVAVPEPVTIVARKRPAARHVPVIQKPQELAASAKPAARWIDPFAE